MTLIQTLKIIIKILTTPNELTQKRTSFLQILATYLIYGQNCDIIGTAPYLNFDFTKPYLFA